MILDYLKKSYNNFIDLKVNIIQIFFSILMVQTILFCISLNYLEENMYMNYYSNFYIIATNLILLGALKFKNTINMKFTLLLSWFFVFYINLRVLSLCYQYPFNIQFIHKYIFTKSDIEGGLLYLLGCLIFTLLGVYLSKYIKIKRLKNIKSNLEIYKTKPFLIGWALVIISQWFIYGYLETSIFSSPDKWGSSWGFIQSFLNPDILITIQIAVVIWLYANLKLTKTILIVTILVTVLYILDSTIAGSRGGPFKILTMIVMILIAFSPTYKIKLWVSLSLFGTLFVINIITFPLGTVIRSMFISGWDFNKQFDQTLLVQNKGSRLGANITYSHENFLFSIANNKKLVLKARPILARLSLFDYIIIIRSAPRNEEIIDNKIRSFYFMRNFLNNIVPGEIWEEANIKTNRFFPMIYRGYELEHVKAYLQSEPYLLFGLAYILSSKFAWLIIFFTAIGCRVIMAIFPDVKTINDLILHSFLITVGMQVLTNFGIDSFLTVTAHMSASFVFFALLFYLLNKKKANLLNV